jgi:hypothetical protein
MEDTKDWVTDGDISGSYVGVLDIITPQELRLNTGLLLKGVGGIRDTTMKIKLESLDVISKSKKSIELEAVADNDDGTSSFFRLYLDKK